jgi:hypothetical protein
MRRPRVLAVALGLVVLAGAWAVTRTVTFQVWWLTVSVWQLAYFPGPDPVLQEARPQRGTPPLAVNLMAYWDYLTNDNDYRILHARAERSLEFLGDVGYLRPHWVPRVESAEQRCRIQRALIRDGRDFLPWIGGSVGTNGRMTIFCRPQDYAVLKPCFGRIDPQPTPVP